MSRVEQARQSYAAELRFTARVRSSAVVNAFASVPREQFVGPGPWRIKSPMDLAEYGSTDDADPRHVYHDALIALDESRGINNGQPSLWAYLFDHLDLMPGEQVLHLGCGTGYYTAIIAELVGSTGQVTAVEIDATVAEKARAVLVNWAQVRVIHADGADTSFEPVDAIAASAGATHPLASWLDALRPGGRLLFPMTTFRDGHGAMLLVKRGLQDGFAARFLCRAGFIGFRGARDPATSRRLAATLRRDQGAAVKSLRRDNHTENETCWFHGEGWCLSRREFDDKIDGRSSVASVQEAERMRWRGGRLPRVN